MSVTRYYCVKLPEDWLSDNYVTELIYRGMSDAAFECIRKEFCPFVSLEAFKASPELKDRAGRSIDFSSLPAWPGYC